MRLRTTYLVGRLAGRCKGAKLWGFLGWTFNLATVTLVFKILSRPYLNIVKRRKFILGKDIDWGCSYAVSCCDLDFTLMTLSKLSLLY